MNIYIGEIGKIIEIDCGTDITGAAEYKILVQKPNGEVAEWTASLIGTNTIRYITQIGDIDIAGTYKLQPKIIFTPNVSEIIGDTVELYIKELFT